MDYFVLGREHNPTMDCFVLGGSVDEGCLTMLCFVLSGSVWGGNLLQQWIVLSKGGVLREEK